MRSALYSWQLWALLSATLAALTAIFAKIGVENVNSDFATFIRAVVILTALVAILLGTGQWQPLSSISGRSYLFLILSGLATGSSWVCYFGRSSSGMPPAWRRSTNSVWCSWPCSGSPFLARNYLSPIGSASPSWRPGLCLSPTRVERPAECASMKEKVDSGDGQPLMFVHEHPAGPPHASKVRGVRLAE